MKKSFVPAPDRPFFSRSKQPFAAPLVMFESTNAVSTEFMVIAAALAVLLVAALYLLHKHQQKAALEAGDPLERPSVIREILTAAQDERSRIDIFSASGSPLPRPLAGFCVQLGARHMYLNSGKSILPENIRSLPLILYFYLNRGGEKVFYSFTGSLSNVRSVEGEHLLEFPLPSHLTNAQKRDFVRICPGPGMVEALLLWKYDPSEAGSLPPNARHLGSPHFSYRPPHAVQAALINISGGGVLLRLAGARLHEVKARFVPGDHFIVLVLLHDLESDSIFTIWLCCTCRRIVRTESTANIELGLKFTHWAQAHKPSAPIGWASVQREGEVPPILAWTLRVQALLSRSRQ